MTNNTCYNFEGIQICPPEESQKVALSSVIGFAAVIGLVVLGYLSAENAAGIGTEFLEDSWNYLGY